MRRPLVGFALALLTGACGDDPAPKPLPSTLYGGDRPVELEVPDELNLDQAYPLYLVLHGYGANGFVQQAYFRAKDVATAGEAFVLAPDGNTDSTGKQFWNADPMCCDFDGTNPDDVGYLAGLIDQISADWPIDPARVYLVGHSNGGFMSYRMACEHADKVTAIAVLAGLASSTPASCNPSQPVSVLHMHGTLDDAVPFAGMQTSVQQWAGKDGCGSTLTTGATIDIETTLAGAETTISTVDGCPAGIAIEQWSIDGGSHIPAFANDYGDRVWTWLSSHAR